MSYSRQDVEVAALALRAALPNARIESWQDYGYKLTMMSPTKDEVLIVFQPERRNIGQPEITMSVVDAVAWHMERNLRDA